MRLRNVRTPGGRSWWTAELCWRELIPWTIGRRSEGSGSALSIGGWPEQRLYSSYRSRRLGCGSQSAALLLQCCDSVEPPLSPLCASAGLTVLFRSAPDAHFTAATHLGTPRSAAPGAGPAHPLGRPHLTETTARPLAPHPRHRTRDLRSRTLACQLSPSRSRKSGVGINADHALNHAPAIAGHDTCTTC
jgi:hypothetical protein